MAYENIGCTRDFRSISSIRRWIILPTDNKEHAMVKTTKNVSIFFGSRGVPARYYKERVMQADMNRTF